jgi:hypothetical protein
MSHSRTAASPLALAAAGARLLAVPAGARAHCDGLDGPVVQAARRALETGKPGPVLAWVRPQDEAEIRAAFARALAVRRGGPEARALADTWFYETLVRVHRAGEGAPYGGLAPAGRDPGPAVAAADSAVRSGSPAAVERKLVETVRHGVHERWARLAALAPPGDDVPAGRAWVDAYVAFVHYVEGVERVAAGAPHAHEGAGDPPHAAGEPHAHGAEPGRSP